MVSRSRSATMSPKSPKSPRISKPSRKSRLRLSCHDCFKAKVKCNKERPGCARCVTIGRECGYVEYDKDGNVIANTACEPEPGDQLCVFGDSNTGLYPFDAYPESGQDWNPALPVVEGSMVRATPGTDLMGDALDVCPDGSMGGPLNKVDQGEVVPLAKPLSAPLAWPLVLPLDILAKQAPPPAQNRETFYPNPRPQTPPLVPNQETFYHNPFQQAAAPLFYQTGSALNQGTTFPRFYADNSTTPLNMPLTPYPTELGTYAAPDMSDPANRPVQHSVCGCVGYCLGELRRLEAVSEGGTGTGTGTTTDMLDLDDILALATGALEECSTLLACEACTQTQTQTPDRQASEMLVGATLVRISDLYLDAACRVALGAKDGLDMVAAAAAAAQRARLAQDVVRFDRVCGAYAQTFGGVGYGDGGGVTTPMVERLGEQLKVLRAVCDGRVGAV